MMRRRILALLLLALGAPAMARAAGCDDLSTCFTLPLKYDATANGGTGSVLLTPGAGITPVTKIPASEAVQGLAFPASGSAAYDITLTANCTLALSGGAAGTLQTITLILRQGGSGGFVSTLPAGILWANGTPPTPDTTAGHIAVITLSTDDAGTTILGNY